MNYTTVKSNYETIKSMRNAHLFETKMQSIHSGFEEVGEVNKREKPITGRLSRPMNLFVSTTNSDSTLKVLPIDAEDAIPYCEAKIIPPPATVGATASFSSATFDPSVK